MPPPRLTPTDLARMQGTPGKVPRKAKVPLEKEVLKACLEWLAAHGWFAWRQNSGAVAGEYKGKRRFMRFNSAPGCSDILAIKAGKLLCLETKRPGGKVSDKQRAFLARAQEAGALAIVAYSVQDLEEKLRLEGIQ